MPNPLRVLVFFSTLKVLNLINICKQGPSIPFLSRLSFNLTRCSFFFAKNAALTAFLSKLSILSTLYNEFMSARTFGNNEPVCRDKNDSVYL